jgi:hypothetical protein
MKNNKNPQVETYNRNLGSLDLSYQQVRKDQQTLKNNTESAIQQIRAQYKDDIATEVRNLTDLYEARQKKSESSSDSLRREIIKSKQWLEEHESSTDKAFAEQLAKSKKFLEDHAKRAADSVKVLSTQVQQQADESQSSIADDIERSRRFMAEHTRRANELNVIALRNTEAIDSVVNEMTNYNQRIAIQERRTSDVIQAITSGEAQNIQNQENMLAKFENMLNTFGSQIDENNTALRNEMSRISTERMAIDAPPDPTNATGFYYNFISGLYPTMPLNAVSELNRQLMDIVPQLRERAINSLLDQSQSVSKAKDEGFNLFGDVEKIKEYYQQPITHRENLMLKQRLSVQRKNPAGNPYTPEQREASKANPRLAVESSEGNVILDDCCRNGICEAHKSLEKVLLKMITPTYVEQRTARKRMNPNVDDMPDYQRVKMGVPSLPITAGSNNDGENQSQIEESRPMVLASKERDMAKDNTMTNTINSIVPASSLSSIAPTGNEKLKLKGKKVSTIAKPGMDVETTSSIDIENDNSNRKSLTDTLIDLQTLNFDFEQIFNLPADQMVARIENEIVPRWNQIQNKIMELRPHITPELERRFGNLVQITMRHFQAYAKNKALNASNPAQQASAQGPIVEEPPEEEGAAAAAAAGPMAITASPGAAAAGPVAMSTGPQVSPMVGQMRAYGSYEQQLAYFDQVAERARSLISAGSMTRVQIRQTINAIEQMMNVLKADPNATPEDLQHNQIVVRDIVAQGQRLWKKLEESEPSASGISLKNIKCKKCSASGIDDLYSVNDKEIQCKKCAGSGMYSNRVKFGSDAKFTNVRQHKKYGGMIREHEEMMMKKNSQNMGDFEKFTSTIPQGEISTNVEKQLLNSYIAYGKPNNHLLNLLAYAIGLASFKFDSADHIPPMLLSNIYGGLSKFITNKRVDKYIDVNQLDDFNTLKNYIKNNAYSLINLISDL